jgi:hypothetical protein
MIETITLITLSLLLMSILRPGKTPPLDSPLIIERPGQYHMTLAPKLNLAQPFIEIVAGLVGKPDLGSQFSTTQYFEVRDNQVTSHGFEYYLLAITFRNGLLYFQANSPNGKQSNSRRMICEFAESVLVNYPALGERKEGLDERIVTAVLKAAELRGIQIKQLIEMEQQ